MGRPLKEWFSFLAAIAVWALIGRGVLETGLVHPIALAVVWLIGFVWIVGYIAAGPRDADRLLIVWLGSLAGTVAVALLVVAAIS